MHGSTSYLRVWIWSTLLHPDKSTTTSNQFLSLLSMQCFFFVKFLCIIVKLSWEAQVVRREECYLRNTIWYWNALQLLPATQKYGFLWTNNELILLHCIISEWGRQNSQFDNFSFIKVHNKKNIRTMIVRTTTFEYDLILVVISIVYDFYNVWLWHSKVIV